LRQLPDDVEAELFALTQATLAAAGYEQYEVSSYARPGRACRHNLTYWRHDPYLGVGAGAHSFSGCPGIHNAASSEWGRRWANAKGPEGYMRAVETAGHARLSEEALSAPQARGELVFLGLRCRDGVRAATFSERFGMDIAAAFPVLAEHADNGLLELHEGWWRLTPRGLLVADWVFASFL
jgi:oxygen-independent coproporphyrinogen-3 oxidase